MPSMLSNTLKARRFFVIDDSGSYGKGLAQAFQKALTAQGGTVVGTQSIKGTESDYRDLARTIGDKGPDLVFYGGSAQHGPGRLVADLRASGLTAYFLGETG